MLKNKKKLDRRTLVSRGAAAALFLSLGLSAATPPADQLNVVTTIPDLADFAREIGGDRVKVRSLSRGTENLHSVPIRPSMLVALSRADVLFQMGLSLESAWLPEVVIAAQNDSVRPGSVGYVDCGLDWEAIQVPLNLSRQQGDLHPQGNPHFNLDPRAGRHLAERVYEGLCIVDPEGEAEYTRRYKAYQKKLDAAEKRWGALTEKLKGRKIAVYHVEYNYFAKYHDMTVSASVEPRPGIPPTPRDLARVIRQIREQDARVLVTASWSNNRQVRKVAKDSGALLLEVPNQVGGAKWASSWIALMDGLHERLIEALDKTADDPKREDA